MLKRNLSTDLNTKIMNISPTLNSKLILLDRVNKGLPVYNGGLGENPLPTPNYLIKTLQENINKKEYTNIEGKDIFKKAVYETYPRNLNNIIVGNGLKELIFSLSFVWDKKIFIPTPCWVTYLEDMKKLDKDFITIPCYSNNNYKLTPELLDESLSKYKGNNSLLFLNSPNNPTGAVYTKDEYISLIKVFNKYNITVFSDEIYYNTSQIETIYLSELYERCILGSSLSKDWASGGWRFGWMLFPDILIDVQKKMASLGSIMYSCPSDFLNHVAAEALTSSKNKEYFVNQKKFFRNIADNVERELNTDDKIISSNFEGAWYKWIDLKNYSVELESMGITNSEELTNRLANEIGLIVVPGKSFGIEGLTFRISMIDEKIFLGIRKLIEWLNRGTEHSCTGCR